MCSLHHHDQYHTDPSLQSVTLPSASVAPRVSSTAEGSCWETAFDDVPGSPLLQQLQHSITAIHNSLLKYYTNQQLTIECRTCEGLDVLLYLKIPCNVDPQE